MTITINKKLTTLDKVDRTREQMKEFKVVYTDGDLLRMFREAVDVDELWNPDEIVYARLEAFPGGFAETDETHYSVDMLVDCWSVLFKIHFYISQSGEVDTRIIEVPGTKPMPMYWVNKFVKEIDCEG